MSSVTRHPSFLILGAAKSGTTSLYHHLGQHPGVYFSKPKGPVFFELEYDKGLEYYWKRYFAEWSGQETVGEGRVYNLYLPYVPERIKQILPDVKLITILRNPVDRAHSHWWHRVTRGYERRSFADATATEVLRLETGRRFEPATSERLWRRNFYPNMANQVTADPIEVPYVEMGYYAEQLERYQALFHAGQLKMLLFEDLKRPEWLVRELLDFLGLQPSDMTDEVPSSNVAGDRIKSRLAFQLERLAWSTGAMSLVPKSVRARLRQLFPAREEQRPPIGRDVRQQLTAHFSSHNRRLEEILQRDLTSWR